MAQTKTTELELEQLVDGNDPIYDDHGVSVDNDGHVHPTHNLRVRVWEHDGELGDIVHVSDNGGAINEWAYLRREWPADVAQDVRGYLSQWDDESVALFRREGLLEADAARTSRPMRVVDGETVESTERGTCDDCGCSGWVSDWAGEGALCASAYGNREYVCDDCENKRG